MLDSTGIAPKGFHFARNILSEKGDFDEPMPYLTRRAVAPVKYYFIDVGISRFFMPHCEDRSFYGSWGQDRTVPEFENEDKPHDPFKVDVYQLGSVFKRITTVRGSYCSGVYTHYLTSRCRTMRGSNFYNH